MKKLPVSIATIVALLTLMMVVHAPGASAASVEDVSVQEQDENQAQSVQINIQVSLQPGESVAYHTVNGTATYQDNDYQQTSGRATCPSGGDPCDGTFAYVTVYGDNDIEDDEQFTVVVDGVGTSTVTILNDDFPDLTPPVLSLPGSLTVEATGPSGAVANFNATATDEDPPNPAVTCDPASGSSFSFGTTTVNCSATDAAGNTATGNFDVTVQDTSGPVLNLPADITVEAVGPTGNVVTYNATADDAVDGSAAVVCNPVSGSTFPLGTTSVSCSATDVIGNTSNGSFEISVVDTTAPQLSVPADITLEATGPSGAAVTFTASATDSVDSSPTVVCNPVSGSTFPIGTTTVTCTATDTAGNSNSASFDVNVVDTTAPTLTVPVDITMEATGPTGAVVTFNVTATDIVDSNPSIVCSPNSGSTFPISTTTVDCSATDATGNVAYASFDIIVEDTTAPALTVPADIMVNATRPAGAVVTFNATATDIVDSNPSVVCSPASGSVFAVGSTTVLCTATDSFGNQTSEIFTVAVTGALDQLNNLYDDVEDSNLSFRTSINLLFKIGMAGISVKYGDPQSACSYLDAFNDQIQSLAGNELTPGEAAQFTDDANRIRSVINCGNSPSQDGRRTR